MTDFPTQARVVIIGGGITGCSIAYHLARLGWTDIVLLEKGELTSGTTFHSVGLVSQFRSSPTQMKLMNYSINLFNELKAEEGEAIGWNPVGSLRLASSPERLKQMQREVSRAKALGLNVDIIGPSEAKRIFPPMTDDNLFGAVHIPDDGWLDSNGITTDFARRARELGAVIRTDTRVTGIEMTESGAVSGVSTDQGNLRCEYVVNAAGQWAPRIGEMVGAIIPMAPIMHQYLITKPIAGHELPRETPVVRDPDNLVYIREEVGGYLVGGFELNPKAWSADGVPWEFTQSLLPPEWDLFDELMEGATRRVPLLERAEIIKLVNGPEAITPDALYCLGPLPGLRGFFVAAGMSLNGIAGAGGVGKIISEWIVEGQPTWDMHEFDVRRFGSIYGDQRYVTERTREIYKYYYHMRFPDDEYEWGRPLRTSPLLPRLESLGAVFGEKNGWERVNHFAPGQAARRAGADQRKWGWTRPPHFEQIGVEHMAARESVALFDMTSFGKIDVTGPGALALLQKLADNNIDKPVGSMTYTQFLNERGGIESDLTITRWGAEHFRVISGTTFVASDLGWMQMHLPADPSQSRTGLDGAIGSGRGDSVAVQEVSEDWACLGLWGPNARDVLQAVTEDDLSNEAFPFMTARVIHVGDVEVWAQRVSYVGELGWELYVRSTPHSPQSAIDVWDRLIEAGRPFEITPAGYKALDTLRVEKGYRYWSADITPDENPYESGQGFCVRLKKGDFIGRAALLRAKEQGLAKRLCTVTLEDDSLILYGGEAVYSDGDLVGRIRSAGYGYSVGKMIGFSYLPVELKEPDTPVRVEVFGDLVPARVERDALHDPAGARLRV